MTLFANLATAQPGDTVSIQLFPAGRHEGIIGSDGYIISRSRRYGGVTSLPPSVFSDGKLRDNHGYIGVLSPEETVRLAEDRIGETGYDVIGHNCVHFVNEVNGLALEARMSDNVQRFASISDIVSSFNHRPLW
ncbi:MAG: lecithin retinol acyltransferase family protein [Robiginitomaculum sp.]|nr:lecithin retinol acyltransferase family protein [Robiginitomaculum sp.]